MRGLDLRVAEGERVLLLGPSGSGKSTLLLAIAGLLDPLAGEEEGELLVAGRPARDARGTAGIVLQDPETNLAMARAGDDVAFGLENRCVPAEEIWPRVDAALAAVGFPYGRDRSTQALSGGEKQRLAIAGALALRPGVLLLDEPTANLDGDGAALVVETLAAILADRRATAVLVEHRVELVLPLVDRVVAIQAGGGVVADGPPAEVFAREGDRLAAAGVWVPGRPLAPAPQRSRVGGALMEARAVSFRYPGSAEAALAGTHAVLRSGDALALVGPNGSGKSTLALLLGGLLRPGAGEVLADEALAWRGERRPWRWPAPRLAERVGSVFQDPEHQFLCRRVDDEVLLGTRPDGAEGTDATHRVEALLERLGLAHLAGANPFTLSGGEKRRLSVATALASAPRVLILDEPTFGQDRRTAAELLALLAGERDAGRALCVATHDRPFVDALADRVLTLAARLAPARPA
ncbi:MAG TPA: ATP-binding cassette domain-containing protein [Candidatus Limnocylindrales bacterium]|nr:ATP-binding cassette domain-containing protein [Candidatus Limnocylindrales bacterium]